MDSYKQLTLEQRYGISSLNYSTLQKEWQLILNDCWLPSVLEILKKVKMPKINLGL